MLDLIKKDEIKYVDFRFTDPRGKWQHLAHHVSTINEEFLTEGVMFDGSSIAGWKAINESDMTLMPDCDTAVLDPFAAQKLLVIFCDVAEPLTGQPYGRDPRSIAKKAEAYLKSSGIGDTAYFGPEAEFFVFDDVRYDVTMNQTCVYIDSEEGPYVTGKKFDEGNHGHRPPVKGGYFPVAPVDPAATCAPRCCRPWPTWASRSRSTTTRWRRASMSWASSSARWCIAPTRCRSTSTWCTTSRTPTARPRPSCRSRSRATTARACTCHQSIWKGGKPLFAGNGYADLSEMALYYIGGIIKHAKAINAFTNPTTNSYKRLIPGFEAPVLLAYSSRNRSASCRIPYVASPKGKRVEVRFPDPLANPYLAFAAMLMAGLDGIQNKIHPGDPMDKNLYDLPPEELTDVPTVCGTLREALESLEADHAFLLKGDVFTKDFIESYSALKWEEVYAFEHTPHPIEYQMYYSS